MHHGSGGDTAFDVVLLRTKYVSLVLFMACVVGSCVLRLFAPSMDESEPIHLHGGWGIASRAMWIIAMISGVVGFAAQEIHRRRLAPVDFKETVSSVAFSEAVGKTDELVARREQSDGTWYVYNDNHRVAAFSEIEGMLGCEINISGTWYTIPGPSTRKGGVLGHDGKLVLKSFGSVWYTGYKIYRDDEVFRLKKKFLVLFRSAYRLSHNREVICRFDPGKGNTWRIRGGRDADITLLVFAFWLIRQDLLYGSS